MEVITLQYPPLSLPPFPSRFVPSHLALSLLISLRPSPSLFVPPHLASSLPSHFLPPHLASSLPISLCPFPSRFVPPHLASFLPISLRPSPYRFVPPHLASSLPISLRPSHLASSLPMTPSCFFPPLRSSSSCRQGSKIRLSPLLFSLPFMLSQTNGLHDVEPVCVDIPCNDASFSEEMNQAALRVSVENTDWKTFKCFNLFSEGNHN